MALIKKPFVNAFQNRMLQNLTGRVAYAFNTCQGMSGSPQDAAAPPPPDPGGGDPRRATRSLAQASHRAGAAVAAGASAWLLVKGSEDWRQFAVVTLNGITLAALFFVVASGFTLIFGLMRVVNMAHGSLYLLGGYLALEMQDGWFKEETPAGSACR